MELEIQSLLKEISQQPDEASDAEEDDALEDMNGLSDVLQLVEKSDFEASGINIVKQQQQELEELEYKSIQPQPDTQRSALNTKNMSAPRKQVSPEDVTPEPSKRVMELPRESTAVKEAKQEIENEFQDLHNASVFIESDSMLVSQTEFIDMNKQPEFMLQAPIMDSILEVSLNLGGVSSNLCRKDVWKRKESGAT